MLSGHLTSKIELLLSINTHCHYCVQSTFVAAKNTLQKCTTVVQNATCAYRENEVLKLKRPSFQFYFNDYLLTVFQTRNQCQNCIIRDNGINIDSNITRIYCPLPTPVNCKSMPWFLSMTNEMCR